MEKKQKKDKKIEKPSEAPTETEPTVVSRPAELPFDPSKIDPEKIKMAEELGVPVGQILEWASSVEARLNLIQESLPTQIQKGMEKAIENARQKAITQQQEALAKGGGGGSDLIKFGQMLMSGGGGMDDEMISLNKEFIRVSIDNMKKRADASDKIVDAVVTKIVAKAVPEIVG